jgi:hypothetical protein
MNNMTTYEERVEALARKILAEWIAEGEVETKDTLPWLRQIARMKIRAMECV